MFPCTSVACVVIGLDIQALPQIPAGHTAVGLPTLGDFLHLVGLGQLALPIMFANGVLHAVISRRQYVRPP